MYGKAIDKDLLRKRLWLGQQGKQPYQSLMQQARPFYRQPNRQSGQAAEIDPVLKACFVLLDLADRAADEIAAEKRAEQKKAEETAAGVASMHDAMGGPTSGGKEAGGHRRSRKGKQVPHLAQPLCLFAFSFFFRTLLLAHTPLA